MGAGKTSGAMHLKDVHGFGYMRYSMVLETMADQGAMDKAELQAFGATVMKSRQHELNELLIARLTGFEHYAVDGLRFNVDHDCLDNRFGTHFSALYIDADRETRSNRLIVAEKRFADVTAFDNADNMPVEAGIAGLRAMSSHVVTNESTLDAYKATIDGIVAGMMQ